MAYQLGVHNSIVYIQRLVGLNLRKVKVKKIAILSSDIKSSELN